MKSAATGYFDDYTRIPASLPAAAWWAARALTLFATLGLVVALVLFPSVGLRLFWGLAIPILPLALALAPGLWRQVCPMALLNQLPRTFGFGLALTLPDRLRNGAFLIACCAFVAFILLRWPLFNESALLLAVGVLLALALALAGGVVFKGRSGWCGTFCALGPIQRVYGQAPVVMVRNGYCQPCLGCQKNCYDFNPRAAVFSDVYDDDPRYAGQRRLFMGFLPGLIVGYFLQTEAPADLGPWRALIPLATGFASAGLYALAVVALPANPYRVAAIFSGAALAAYYWWAGPNVVNTLGWAFGFAPPDGVVAGAGSLGFLGGLVLVASGLRSERRFEAARASAAEAPAGRPAPILARLGGGGREVTDRATSVSFAVKEEATLLEAIQSAGLKISYGCRLGICGADPVVICDGAENLSAAGDDERATLRRLGLEGRARLACVCKVSGPVIIDRDPHSAGAAATEPPEAPAVDRAIAAGIERVVIVGNGVAGMGVAEGLRRESPSLRITLVTNEPSHFYNRMAIGRVVYDGSGMDGLQLTPDSWYGANDVTVLRNTVAASIDRDHRRLQLATGEPLPYDRLILATGARASTPTPDFLNYRNAFVLRSADDARALRAHVQMTGARRAAVIGGGVLGVEAADALRRLGLQVAILQRANRLMNAQLDERGAAKLQAYLDSVGVQSVCNASIASFEGVDTIAAARLAHGPRVRADIFVACLGIQSNAYLAERAGLAVARGIKVDAAMRTSDPAIFAVGDAAETATGPGGLWPIAAAQATAALEGIFGGDSAAGDKAPEPPPVVMHLKCDGIDLYSYGLIQPGKGDQEFTAQEQANAWWRIVARNSAIVGGLFVGPPGAGRRFHDMLRKPEEAGATLAALRSGAAPDFLRGQD